MIALSKGFGWFVTGSPTLFAETVHSLADVGNQVLLKVGEVRGRGAGPIDEHPFGRGQEKYFWALVSAVSVFFIGCGINLYHGVHALLNPEAGGAVLAAGDRPAAVRARARVVDLRRRAARDRRLSRHPHNRNNTTVLAVLLEDAVALLGIVLTLIGRRRVVLPRPASGVRCDASRSPSACSSA